MVVDHSSENSVGANERNGQHLPERNWECAREQRTNFEAIANFEVCVGVHSEKKFKPKKKFKLNLVPTCTRRCVFCVVDRINEREGV